jgi:cobalamin biosynthesis protein CobT
VTEKEAAKEAVEKEVAEKEVAGKEAAEKSAVEKEAVEKEAAEKGDDDEEEDQSWRPSESSDDDGPVCFKCPICFNHLYQHKNSLVFHIKYMMTDEFLPPNVVEWHRQLNRLIDIAICDP